MIRANHSACPLSKESSETFAWLRAIRENEKGSPSLASSSFTCKASFPNLWWWWKRHPFPSKNWLLALVEELFTPCCPSDRGTQKKYNITPSFRPKVVIEEWRNPRGILEYARQITQNNVQRYSFLGSRLSINMSTQMKMKENSVLCLL